MGFPGNRDHSDKTDRSISTFIQVFTFATVLIVMITVPIIPIGSGGNREPQEQHDSQYKFRFHGGLLSELQDWLGSITRTGTKSPVSELTWRGIYSAEY